MSQITQQAIDFLLERTEKPALAHPSLEKEFKNKVINSVRLLKQFKKIGDLCLYLDRFAGDKQVNPIYKRMQALELQTFEDVLPEFEQRFQAHRYDCTNLDDFVIGEVYSSWDIAIFSRSYNVQRGIYLIGPDEGRLAIFVKSTFGGEGKYPNEWLQEGQELKYYLKSIKGNFSPDYKENKAIIESGETPIYVFRKIETALHLIGIFRFADLHTEIDGSMWFRLIKRDLFEHQHRMRVDEYRKDLDQAVRKSQIDDIEKRAERLEKSSKKPKKILTSSVTYQRNPDVIAEVLVRAAGVCECCKQDAPFVRASNGTPYLEVHHRKPLAQGGDDTVDNALALCPNCHRYLHLGTVKEFNQELTNWYALEAEAGRRGRESWQNWVLEECPIGDWPGRQLLDFANLGDPGYWIQDNLCGEELIQDPSVDKVIADDLTQSFLRTQAEDFGESFTDFCEPSAVQDILDMLADDFVAFIQEWRKRVWAKLDSSKSNADSSEGR